MGMLKFLKESQDARKIFGRGELKIMEKQMLGVSLSQSEKNRLSRDVRRKLEFIRKIAGFEREFKIKKGSEIKKMLEETKEIIMADALIKKIKRVVLFGSAAEGMLTLSSDIDIAVEFDRITLADATLFRKRISGKVNSKMDVQVYNILPNKVRREINSKGKVLYQR